MKQAFLKKLNKASKAFKKAAPFLLPFFGFIFTVTVFAWFYSGRIMTSVVEITNPTAIFINAGNEEDIRYLDLGRIDAESGAEYKDFVFCVRGTYVAGYRLQLAYTTNNQFEYEIYPASVTTNSAAVPANAESCVEYDTHGASSVTQYYYALAGATPLAGSFLNEAAGGEEQLAKNNDVYHDLTYTPDGESSPYPYRHKYAIPLYWQARDPVHPAEGLEFCDYYILRVKWEAGKINDKETDIIYISAKNFTN